MLLMYYLSILLFFTCLFNQFYPSSNWALLHLHVACHIDGNDAKNTIASKKSAIDQMRSKSQNIFSEEGYVALSN